MASSPPMRSLSTPAISSVASQISSNNPATKLVQQQQSEEGVSKTANISPSTVGTAEYWKHLDFLALAAKTGPQTNVEDISQLISPLFTDPIALDSLGTDLSNRLLSKDKLQQSNAVIVPLTTGFGFEHRLAHSISRNLNKPIINLSIGGDPGGNVSDCTGNKFEWNILSSTKPKQVILVTDWAPSGGYLVSAVQSLSEQGIQVVALCGLFLPLNRSCFQFDNSSVIFESAWPLRHESSPDLPWPNQLECSCEPKPVSRQQLQPLAASQTRKFEANASSEHGTSQESTRLQANPNSSPISYRDTKSSISREPVNALPLSSQSHDNKVHNITDATTHGTKRFEDEASKLVVNLQKSSGNTLKRKLTEPLSDLEDSQEDSIQNMYKPTHSTISDLGLQLLEFDQVSWIGSGGNAQNPTRKQQSTESKTGKEIQMTPPDAAAPSGTWSGSPLTKSTTCPMEVEGDVKKDSTANTYYVKHRVAAVAANSPCEDRFTATYCKQLDAWMYAVMDGHGGWLVAEYVKQHLPTRLFDALRSKIKGNLKSQGNGSAVDRQSPFRTPTDENHQATQWLNHSDVSAAMNEAFEAIDREVLEHVQVKTQQQSRTASGSPNTTPNTLRRSTRGSRDPSAKADFTTGRNSGSCAIVALLFQGFVYVANTGDCRAVIGSMETDTQDPAARARLLAIGGDPPKHTTSNAGHVEDHTFEHGKNGSPLIVSRTFQENLARLQRAPLFSPHKSAIPVGPSKSSRKRPRLHVHTGDQSPNLNQQIGRQEVRVTSSNNLTAKKNHRVINTGSILRSVESLSRDHTCDDAGEAIRVVRRSGDKNAIRLSKSDKAINNIMGPLRVAGSLIVTRAFGDLYLKGSAARLQQSAAGVAQCTSGTTNVVNIPDKKPGLASNVTPASSSSAGAAPASSSNVGAAPASSSNVGAAPASSSNVGAAPASSSIATIASTSASCAANDSTGSSTTSTPKRLHEFPRPYITVCPEIVARAIRPGDEFLVLASDGLWNFLSNEEVIKCIMEQDDSNLALGPVLQSLTISASAKGMTLDKLLTLATSKKKRSIHDDITCIVVRLN